MIQEKLRELARSLLTDADNEKRVDLVIGFGNVGDSEVAPIFVTDANNVDRLVWSDACVANLATYLHRPEVKKFNRVAIVVKGCDAKSLAVLEAESQIDRKRLVVIGVACSGVAYDGKVLARCNVCDVQMPRGCDVVVGEATSQNVSPQERYAAVQAFCAKPREERWEYWKRELSRCLKCYACRQVCPLCYCQQCIVDKNRPQRIETSSHLQGNVAWNVTRAFHLAGRCTMCGSCGAVCPVGIDLGLLNASLAKTAEEQFDGFRSGYDPNVLPVIGKFSETDNEEFIR
ncbi:MAG: 4Fe-4S dicluster domain-containing protein [Thermoguttaceae bacterium]